MDDIAPQIETFLRLSKLITVDDRMVSGDKQYQLWAEEIVGLFIAPLNIYGCGGIVVPQFGQQAGEPIPSQVKAIPPHMCVEKTAIEKIAISYWEKHSQSAVIYDVACQHKKTHLACVLVPITFSFEKPIGYFWALSNKEDSLSVKEALQAAVNTMALSVSAERAINAIQQLSKIATTKDSKTKEIAEQIAQACMIALSCSAVIIWELDLHTENLKTITSLGAINRTMHVDMKHGKGIAGKCASDNSVIMVDDLQDTEELKLKGLTVEHPQVVKDNGWHCSIFVPLVISSDVIGVLAVYGPRPRGFSSIDKKILLAFAQRLSAEYVHAKHKEEMSEIERKLTLEATTIEAGMLAMERVHDIDNHIIFAQGFLSRITSEFRHDKDNKINRWAISAGNNIDNAHKLVKALVSRLRMRKLTLSRCNLKELVKQVVGSIELEAKTAGVNIRVHIPEDIELKVDRERIERVFLNLINNSLYWLETDAKGQRKEIHIEAERTGDLVAIHIRDNGPGIAPSDISKMFNYFYTTKSDKGMGLGLPIANNLIKEHKGQITVKSKWGFEAEFTIQLPLSPS